MTNDTSSNYWLQKYSEPLPDRLVNVVRSIMLFRLLSADCQGVSSRRSVFNAYARESGFLSLTHDAAQDASRQGAALFDGFDYEALAHLYAGTAYLFGAKGILIKNAMTEGTGKPAFPYKPDANNPYLVVRPLLPD